MSIGEFLRNRIGLQARAHDLQALDGLGGQRIGNTTFYTDLDECMTNIDSWMPIYFLPIGVESGLPIGIHLRPSDVAARHLAIIQAVEEDAMIEVAGSLRHYVYRCLAQKEGFLNEEGTLLPSFEQGVLLANGLFGKDFYQAGRHGHFTVDEADELASKQFGGTPEVYHEAARTEDDPLKKLIILEQGITVEPACMKLYINAAKLHYELDDKRRAAETLARSLNCFHHTSYGTDLDEYYEMGRSLLEAMPAAFSEEARRDLTTVGEKERLNLVMVLYQDEQFVEATKMLCDLCHSYRDYNAPLELLRKHYGKLGWEWEMALCELRDTT